MKWHYFAAGSLTLAGAILWACSTSETPGTSSGDPTPASDAGTPLGDAGTPVEDAMVSSDGASDAKPLEGADASCSDYALDAGNPCGAMPFGQALVPFTKYDGGDDAGYVGGTLVPGIYDAVLAERANVAAGSWRETFVLGCGGEFTRIRQIDVGAGGGPGPVTYRAGKLAMNGSTGVFTYSCAVTGDAGVEAGVDNFPAEIIKGPDGKYLMRYGAAFVRITLKRRDP